MRSDQQWVQIVFRLRQLPNNVTDPTDAAKLLATALQMPAHHVVVSSIATTLDKWEPLPSKVATLQFRAVPARLQNASHGEDEWMIEMPGQTSGQVLILDIHFKGLTPLNDVEPVKHRAEYVAPADVYLVPSGAHLNR